MTRRGRVLQPFAGRIVAGPGDQRAHGFLGVRARGALALGRGLEGYGGLPGGEVVHGCCWLGSLVAVVQSCLHVMAGTSRPRLSRRRKNVEILRRRRDISIRVRRAVGIAPVPGYCRRYSMSHRCGQESPWPAVGAVPRDSRTSHDAAERDLQPAHPRACREHPGRRSGSPMPTRTATAHSKLCGSTVTVDLEVEDDQVTAFGQTVKACLLGPGRVLRHGPQHRRQQRARAARGGCADAQDAQGRWAAAHGPVGRPRRARARQGLQGAACLHAPGVRCRRGGARQGRRRRKGWLQRRRREQCL